MKRVIRKSIFETNSSSTQSLCLKIKDKDERWKTEKELEALDHLKEETEFHDEIHREIRSKYAKIIILYQTYINQYLEERVNLIQNLAEYPGIKLKSEKEYYKDHTEFYNGELEDYLSYDYDKLDQGLKDEISRAKEYLDRLFIERKEVVKKLTEEANKLDSDDKKAALSKFKKIEKDPGRDDTAIGEFFGNSLLDFYQGDYTIFDFARKLNIDQTEPKMVLKLIDKMLEDDVYFETVEGLMPEDGVPRIS